MLQLVTNSVQFPKLKKKKALTVSVKIIEHYNIHATTSNLI